MDCSTKQSALSSQKKRSVPRCSTSDDRPASLASNRLLERKAFIFDFYGTLVDEDESIVPAWRYLKDLGFSSHPEIEAVFEPDGFDGCLTPRSDGSPSHDDWHRENWRQFVRLSGVPPEKIDATTSGLIDMLDSCTTNPAMGAADVLGLLRSAGFKIGLCSNWERPIRPYLEQSGLTDFDAISVSADVGARKPHAAIFQDACDKLGVRPEEAVFVGDNWATDIVGAMRAELLPVWIRRDRESRGIPHLVAEFEALSAFSEFLQSNL